jgi:hypothetical protein
LYAIALNSVLSKVTEKAAEFSKAFADRAQVGSVRDYIRQYLQNHLALIEEVPEYPRMMAWENLEGGRTLARLPLQATYQSFLGRVKQIMAPLNERGVLREGFSVAYVAQAVMALTHYFVIHRGTIQHLFLLDPEAKETREAWVSFCADMFLASFANAQ